jgi:hypothetical protein
MRRFPPAMQIDDAIGAWSIMERSDHAAILPDYAPLGVPQLRLQRAPLELGVTLEVFLWYHPAQRQVARVRVVVDEILRLAAESRGSWFQAE